jgi:adenylate kinase family enzyme
MNNIFVVGTSGSGKSTLAKEIASRLSIPHIEMDAILWLPNWEKRNPKDFKRVIQKLMAENKRVVIDGNFLGKELEPASGDTLIFLDYPRLLVFSRILRRSIRRLVFRQKLWSGNREEWKFLFSRDFDLNPVLFSWISHEQRRTRYSEYVKSRKDIHSVTFSNPRQVAQFLKDISKHID